MIYCSKCGVQLLDEAVFCSACGASVAKPEGAQQQASQQQASQQQASQQQASQQQYTSQQGYGQGYSQTYVNYNDPIADANANKVYGILAYLGILVLISIFAAPKESKYSRFHANQGLVLVIVEVGVAAILGILQGILTAIFINAYVYVWLVPPVFGLMFGLLWLAYTAGCITFIVLGIINAANNKLKPLPIIGKYTILR
jgi:uncharacterized membrane protein